MKVISTIGKYTAAQPCSLTIGTFDGVHIGHREIIQRLVKVQKKKKSLSRCFDFLFLIREWYFQKTPIFV